MNRSGCVFHDVGAICHTPGCLVCTPPSVAMQAESQRQVMAFREGMSESERRMCPDESMIMLVEEEG